MTLHFNRSESTTAARKHVRCELDSSHLTEFGEQLGNRFFRCITWQIADKHLLQWHTLRECLLRLAAIHGIKGKDPRNHLQGSRRKVELKRSALGGNVRRLGTFLPLFDIKTDSLTFVQRLES